MIAVSKQSEALANPNWRQPASDSEHRKHTAASAASGKAAHTKARMPLRINTNQARRSCKPRKPQGVDSAGEPLSAISVASAPASNTAAGPSSTSILEASAIMINKPSDSTTVSITGVENIQFVNEKQEQADREKETREALLITVNEITEGRSGPRTPRKPLGEVTRIKNHARLRSRTLNDGELDVIQGMLKRSVSCPPEEIEDLATIERKSRAWDMAKMVHQDAAIISIRGAAGTASPPCARPSPKITEGDSQRFRDLVDRLKNTIRQEELSTPTHAGKRRTTYDQVDHLIQAQETWADRAKPPTDSAIGSPEGRRTLDSEQIKTGAAHGRKDSRDSGFEEPSTKAVTLNPKAMEFSPVKAQLCQATGRDDRTSQSRRIPIADLFATGEKKTPVQLPPPWVQPPRVQAGTRTAFPDKLNPPLPPVPIGSPQCLSPQCLPQFPLQALQAPAMPWGHYSGPQPQMATMPPAPYSMPTIPAAPVSGTFPGYVPCKKPKGHHAFKQQQYEAWIEHRKATEPGYAQECKMRQLKRSTKNMEHKTGPNAAAKNMRTTAAGVAASNENVNADANAKSRTTSKNGGGKNKAVHIATATVYQEDLDALMRDAKSID